MWGSSASRLYGSAGSLKTPSVVVVGSTNGCVGRDPGIPGKASPRSGGAATLPDAALAIGRTSSQEGMRISLRATPAPVAGAKEIADLAAAMRRTRMRMACEAMTTSARDAFPRHGAPSQLRRRTDIRRPGAAGMAVHVEYMAPPALSAHKAVALLVALHLIHRPARRRLTESTQPQAVKALLPV